MKIPFSFTGFCVLEILILCSTTESEKMDPVSGCVTEKEYSPDPTAPVFDQPCDLSKGDSSCLQMIRSGDASKYNDQHDRQSNECLRYTRLKCLNSTGGNATHGKCVCAQEGKHSISFQWHPHYKVCYVRPYFECMNDTSEVNVPCSPSSKCHLVIKHNVKICSCIDIHSKTIRVNTNDPNFWTCSSDKGRPVVIGILISFLIVTAAS